MSNKLSHSSVSRFQTCPTSWKLHYAKRYRPKLQSSALLFGTAIDKAFETMVQGGDGKDMFEKVWTFQIINGNTEFLPDSSLLAYYQSDIEMFLLDEQDKAKLNEWLAKNTPETRNWTAVYDDCDQEREMKGFQNIHEGKRQFLNYVAWLSMRQKGLLMVQTLQEKVLPKITKVVSTQEEVKLKLEEGSSITGFTDLICQWEPYQNDTIIFDLKTSSKAYEADSVLNSPQLALYAHAFGEKHQTNLCGFIVLGKRIIKNKTKICSVCKVEGTGSRARTCDQETDGIRCGGAWEESFKPEIMLQIIVDKISKERQQFVLENISEIDKAIQAGVFVKNLQSCIMPYGKCSFYNICHNNDASDLIQLEDKKTEKEATALIEESFTND